MAKKHPNESPYSAFGNNPIIFVDTDGRDYTYSTTYQRNAKGEVIGKIVHVDVKVKVLNVSNTVVNSSDLSTANQFGSTIFNYKAQSSEFQHPENTANPGEVVSVPTTVSVNVSYEMVKDLSSVKQGENVLLLVDEISAMGAEGSIGLAELEGNVGAVKVSIHDKALFGKVILHETAHLLGIPDTYTANTPGYGLMGSLDNGARPESRELQQHQKEKTGLHYRKGKGKEVSSDAKNNAKKFGNDKTKHAKKIE